MNEIVCFRLDGSRTVLVVAPNMTDLNASGGGSDDYSKRPKGNLDPTGEYFHLDHQPRHQSERRVHRPDSTAEAWCLRGAPAPSPSPTPGSNPAGTITVTSAFTDSGAANTGSDSCASSCTRPSPTGSVRWMSLINMSSTSGGLRKTGGCDGCPDASAVSEQQISSTGTLTFVASESASLRFVGLAAGGIGTGPGDINFALRLQSGVAEVREAGAYKSDVRFAAGDTFAIAISSGVVKYSKNGSGFYTSTVRADRAVRAHACSSQPMQP